MSYSRWLGKEPREVTTYEYDTEGRLAQAVTVREPEWSDDDRAWALALIAEEKGLCAGGCGHPAEEAHDPETARTWTVDTVTCEACRVLQAVVETDAKDNPQRGRLYGVRRTGTG